MAEMMLVIIVPVLVSAFIFGVITMFVARSRGRGMFRWFLVGFFLSWVGTVIVLCAGRTAVAEAKHALKVKEAQEAMTAERRPVRVDRREE